MSGFTKNDLSTIGSERLRMLAEVAHIRFAAVNYLKKKQREKFYGDFELLGVSQEELEGVSNKDDTAFFKVRAVLEEGYDEKDPYFKILKKYINRAELEFSSSGDCARETLEEELLRKCLIQRLKKAKISPREWTHFEFDEDIPQKDTVEKLIYAFKLNENEAEEFKSLIIKKSFALTKEFRMATAELLVKSGTPKNDFLNYSSISEDAFKKFGIKIKKIKDEDKNKVEDNKAEDNKSDGKNGSPIILKDYEGERMVAQTTLLKLVIGFGLNEKDAVEYLKKTKSGFYKPDDMVFRAAIHAKRNTPEDVYALLIYFYDETKANKYYRK